MTWGARWRQAVAAGGVLLVALLGPARGIAVPATAASPEPVSLHRFGSPEAFVAGNAEGVQQGGGGIMLAGDAAAGAWLSPLVDPGFPFTRLIASWNGDTPPGSRIRVEARATTDAGSSTRWYVLGLWTDSVDAGQSTSVPGQADADARVATDTLLAQGRPLVAYQLRVTLERPTPMDPSPTVRLLAAAVAAAAPSPMPDGVSPPGGAAGIELPVPAYSQEVHAHQYPQWGGGGEAWCSPTATEMVVESWGRGPTPDELDWVDPSYADPSVDVAARSTYDAAYRGTGNWPFNTAYAARYGLEAFVTQLRSLAEAERFIMAGIPLVASIAAGPHELDGFLFPGGTSGHLVVVVGFDGSGNPIVNDPAAWSDASVRRVYGRGQFERAWLRGSGGVVYVVHPPDVPLPPLVPGAPPNW